MPNGKDLSGLAGRDVRQDASFTSFSDYSSPNPAMIKQNGLTFILTYAQSEFLLAEAAQRWGIGGVAADHYKNGVAASITFLGQYDASLAISENVAQNYATAHPYNAANGLEMINNQYWAHTNTMLDFYETWSNWRRSGFPALTPIVYPGNATNGTIPRRFPYPVEEGAKNGINYKEASAAVPGGDKLTGRVWWDKQ
ncbi:SusD/RagB family nutrient-binding outer membrane lipoprotein [Pedobacter steynii]